MTLLTTRSRHIHYWTLEASVELRALPVVQFRLQTVDEHSGASSNVLRAAALVGVG